MLKCSVWLGGKELSDNSLGLSLRVTFFTVVSRDVLYCKNSECNLKDKSSLPELRTYFLNTFCTIVLSKFIAKI